MFLLRTNPATQNYYIDIDKVWKSVLVYLIMCFHGKDFDNYAEDIFNNNEKLWKAFCDYCLKITSYNMFPLKTEKEIENLLFKGKYEKEQFLNTCIFKKSNGYKRINKEEDN